MRNINTQRSTNFKLEISNVEFDYFIQNTNVPSVTLGAIDTPWQNFAGSVPDNRLEYESLNVSFLLAEDFKNYQFILDWMKRCADVGRLRDQFRDITLHVTNNNKLSNVEFRFINAYPIMLGDLSFESGTTDTTPILVSAIFKYHFFEIHFRDPAN